MMRSLQTRLMLGIGIATTVILVVSSGLLFVLVRVALIHDLDNAILIQGRALATMTEFNDGKTLIDVEAGDLPEFQPSARAAYFELRDGQGKTIDRSRSLGGESLPSFAGERRFIQLPSGIGGRALAMRVRPRAEQNVDGKAAVVPPEVLLIVARDTADLTRVLARVGGLLAAVCSAAVIALLITTLMVIRRALLPVNRVAGNIERIGESNLRERLDGSGIPRELLPIVTRLNGLLSRLDSAFERERSFTADAAHELRTPLAGLEAALEVCAGRRRAPEAYEKVVQDCLGVVRGMHSMVDSLLLLARADAKQVQLSSRRVIVDEVVDEAWQNVSSIAERRGLRVNWDVDSIVAIESDPDKLLQILNNLLDNAARYADEGGRIDVHVSRSGGQAVIRVANSGSRIAAGESDRVFDRYWRGDASRASGGNNCGLGLAVSQKLVAVLGGSIGVTSEDGGDFVVELRLPGEANGSDSASGAEALPNTNRLESTRAV